MRKDKEQQPKWVKLVNRVAEKVSFNPYDRKQLGVFLAVIAAGAGAAGYYGLRSEKKEKK
jgi:hypothetical protein